MSKLDDFPEFQEEKQPEICLNCMKETKTDPETGLCEFCSTHLLIEGRGDLERGEGNNDNV